MALHLLRLSRIWREGPPQTNYSFTLGRLPQSGISYLIFLRLGLIGICSALDFTTLGTTYRNYPVDFGKLLNLSLLKKIFNLFEFIYAIYNKSVKDTKINSVSYRPLHACCF